MIWLFIFWTLQARKFLPYGFGPGGKTIIEDAASFDDDEEDYGDYQVRGRRDREREEGGDGGGVVKFM